MRGESVSHMRANKALISLKCAGLFLLLGEGIYAGNSLLERVSFTLDNPPPCLVAYSRFSGMPKQSAPSADLPNPPDRSKLFTISVVRIARVPEPADNTFVPPFSSTDQFLLMVGDAVALQHQILQATAAAQAGSQRPVYAQTLFGGEARVENRELPVAQGRFVEVNETCGLLAGTYSGQFINLRVGRDGTIQKTPPTTSRPRRVNPSNIEDFIAIIREHEKNTRGQPLIDGRCKFYQHPGRPANRKLDPQRFPLNEHLSEAIADRHNGISVLGGLRTLAKSQLKRNEGSSEVTISDSTRYSVRDIKIMTNFIDGLQNDEILAPTTAERLKCLVHRFAGGEPVQAAEVAEMASTIEQTIGVLKTLVEEPVDSRLDTNDRRQHIEMFTLNLSPEFLERLEATRRDREQQTSGP